jgi:hypothetical protein
MTQTKTHIQTTLQTTLQTHLNFKTTHPHRPTKASTDHSKPLANPASSAKLLPKSPGLRLGGTQQGTMRCDTELALRAVPHSRRCSLSHFLLERALLSASPLSRLTSSPICTLASSLGNSASHSIRSRPLTHLHTLFSLAYRPLSPLLLSPISLTQ